MISQVNKTILMCFTVLFLLLACEQKTPTHNFDQEEKIKNTIILYNALLAEGYRNLNMNALTQIATEERRVKAYHHMSALGETGVKMDAVLKDLKFREVNLIDPVNAEAGTEEIWDYIYIDIDSGDSAYNNRITYKNNYRLINRSGKWVVADITIEESDEEKDDEFLPFRKSDKSTSFNEQERKGM